MRGVLDCACSDMFGRAMVACWGWHLCYGFVLLAAAGGSQLLEPGSSLNYNYEATLLLNEAEAGSGKDVGFQISAQLSLETVWEAAQNKLLYLKVTASLIPLRFQFQVST